MKWRERLDLPEATPQFAALLIQGAATIVSCWKIERTDGTILRFTDHDRDIAVDGSTYTPADGLSSTAERHNENLGSRDTSYSGIVSDSSITVEDLEAGRYREAKVTEYLVDWTRPDVGPLRTKNFWINDIVFTDEMWEAEVEGLTSYLRQKFGRKFTRECDTDLFSTECGVTRATYELTGQAVSSVVTQRKKFQTDITSIEDDWFNDGELTWTSGNNSGITCPIKDYTETGGVVELWLPTPFDVSVSDEFDIVPGCNKLSGADDSIGHCKNKFSNLVNFQGFPFIPGTDKMYETPNAK